MKKLLFLLLALPIFATAQEKTVQVPPCVEGNSFTIRIPVRFPENVTVQYAWYCNDTLVEDSHMLLLGEKTISYTIPAEKAYGSALYHFKYNLHDDHDGSWTESPYYLVTFHIPPPSSASEIAGSTTVCANATGLTYTVDNVEDVSYSWAVPKGWTITAGGTTNSITVTAGTASGNVSVTLSNSGGSGEPRTLAVTVNSIPAQPSTITGTTPICANTTGHTYSVTSVSGVTYTWAFPSGWSQTAGTTTNSITVTAGTAGGDIKVTPKNTSSGCVGTARTLTVTVNALPAQPSTITGTTPVCASTTGLTYSVTNVSGTTYTWTLPSGWSQTAGTTTNSITVTAGTAGGDIKVTPKNTSSGCVGTARTLAITVNAASTLTRSGGAASQTVCTGTAITNIVYARGGSATGTSISWSPSTPAGITFTASSGTISGTPTSSGAFTYTITTSGHTAPCKAVTATGTITVNAVPAQPSTITGSTNVCASAPGLTYSVTSISGVTYNWALPSGWTKTAGGTTNSITVTATTTSGNISVTPNTTCGNGTARTLAVSTVTCGTSSCSGLNTPGAIGISGSTAWKTGTVNLEPGLLVSFTSESPATGTSTVSYQWYRNGSTISGATSATYNLPAANAAGVNVQFKRGATVSSCSGSYYASNTITITFCNSTLTVGNVCWADVNVDAPNTFANRPDMYTQFYQWNRSTAWAPSGAVSGWNKTADNSSTWTINPCPTGWRLPTFAEAKELVDGGYTKAKANAKGNAVAGGFFGPNHASCTLPSNMTNCIFLPACGRLADTNGVLGNQGDDGHVWTSTESTSTLGYNLYNDNSNTIAKILDSVKAYGFNIRCVSGL